MTEKTEALIAEARRQVGHIEDKSMRERLISDLADALAALTAPQERDARDLIAREAYRELYPGPINTHDSNRTRESDLAEMDRAYAIWDGGREGFAPGIICRRVADRILAAFPVLSRAVAPEPSIEALRAARAEAWDEAIATVFAWWAAAPEDRPAVVVNPYGVGLPVGGDDE